MTSTPTDAGQTHRGHRRHPRIRSRSNVQRLVISAGRLVSLEVQLWLLRTQRSLHKVVIFAFCAFLGAIATLVGTVFLYIFLFQLLAHALGSKWAVLIFAVVHLAAAGALFATGYQKLNAKSAEE